MKILDKCYLGNAKRLGIPERLASTLITATEKEVLEKVKALVQSESKLEKGHQLILLGHDSPIADSVDPIEYQRFLHHLANHKPDDELGCTEACTFDGRYAVGYLRVSSDDQANGIAAQIDGIFDLLGQVDVFPFAFIACVEKGGILNEHRTGLQAAMRLACCPGAEGIGVAYGDRFSRHLREGLDAFFELGDHDKKLFLPQGRRRYRVLEADSIEPMDCVDVAEAFADAQDDNALRSKRVKDGYRDMKNLGYWAGEHEWVFHRSIRLEKISKSTDKAKSGKLRCKIWIKPNAKELASQLLDDLHGCKVEIETQDVLRKFAQAQACTISSFKKQLRNGRLMGDVGNPLGDHVHPELIVMSKEEWDFLQTVLDALEDLKSKSISRDAKGHMTDPTIESIDVAGSHFVSKGELVLLCNAELNGAPCNEPMKVNQKIPPNEDGSVQWVCVHGHARKHPYPDEADELSWQLDAGECDVCRSRGAWSWLPIRRKGFDVKKGRERTRAIKVRTSCKVCGLVLLPDLSKVNFLEPIPSAPNSAEKEKSKIDLASEGRNRSLSDRFP
jgi:DNA invertase Pin-like site-specific DNA recombinase